MASLLPPSGLEYHLPFLVLRGGYGCPAGAVYSPTLNPQLSSSRTRRSDLVHDDPMKPQSQEESCLT
jgi:hypothetical protein